MKLKQIKIAGLMMAALVLTTSTVSAASELSYTDGEKIAAGNIYSAEYTIRTPHGVVTQKDALELTLANPSGEDTIVRVSPLNISVEKDAVKGMETIYSYIDMYFRMQDGSVKTFTELFEWSSLRNARENPTLDDYPRYIHFAEARETLDLSQIKSIIVGNLEYDLNDPTQAKEMQLDAAFSPFTVNLVPHPEPAYQGAIKMLPAREVVERLGGTATYDPVTQNVTLQYRGTTLEVRDGAYFKDGEPFAIGGIQPVTVNGVLTIHNNVFDSCFKVSTTYVPERETADGKTEAYWVLIP